MRVLHERAPRAPLRPPGLLARLRTPARGWRRPRQQLERQRRCPRRTRGCRWLWSPLRPLHLPASSAAQPFRRAQGAGTHGLTREGLPEPGAGVCASHPGPLGSRLGARGLGRSSAQPISNCLDAVGGVLRWRGSQLPLPAPVSGEELVPGTPEEDLGGSSPPRPHPCGRGVVWVGPASPAAAALCASGVSSDRLLHSPPGRLSCPSPVLPAHLHAGFSTQGVGGGEAVGARMLKGCRAPGPELLS